MNWCFSKKKYGYKNTNKQTCYFCLAQYQQMQCMWGETYKRYTNTHMRRPHSHKTDEKNDPNSNTDEKKPDPNSN